MVNILTLYTIMVNILTLYTIMVNILTLYIKVFITYDQRIKYM